jgi:hypothetical protein
MTRTSVAGVFTDRASAQSAVDDLKRLGFTDGQIGVIATHVDDPAVNHHTGRNIAEGCVIGAATGAGVGALWALGIAAQLFPPLGVVIGGSLMAFLASAGTGAAIGTVLGALTAAGIPDDEARFYEAEIRAGRTLVTVEATTRASEAHEILRRHGAYDMDSRNGIDRPWAQTPVEDVE